MITSDALLDTFIDSKYCDLQARPKIAKALIRLSQRIPEDVFNGLSRIVVFAPNPHDYGLCIPLMQSNSSGDDAFIYFAPSLERHSQDDVDFTVAHEFAHAALQHHKPENLMTFSMDEAKKGYLDWNSEVAADQLVADWGYKIPKRRKRKH
jgi:predicted metal-dependent peptidase